MREGRGLAIGFTLVVFGSAAASLPRNADPSSVRPVAQPLAPVTIGALTRPDPATMPRGTIVGWGRNDYGQATPPSADADFVAVAGRVTSSLALRADGSLVAWPSGIVPTPNTGFVAIAAGSNHYLALKDDGSIIGWNGYAQFDAPPPNEGFVAVDAGSDHSVALKEDGSIVAWGSNLRRQLEVPLPNTDFVAIAAGSYHNLAVKADGAVVAWGSNQYGAITVPLPNAGFVAVAAGGDPTGGQSVGLKADGTVAAWGDTVFEQGWPPNPNGRFREIACGDYHNLALTQTGAIVVWGAGSKYVGFPNYGQDVVPTPKTGFIAIAGGGQHSLAIRRLPGDFEADGYVDLHDAVEFLLRFDGPGIRPEQDDWHIFDWDTDTDVDLADFAFVQNGFTGD